MIWLDKKWLAKALSPGSNVDFNNFRKYELVAILLSIRVRCLLREELYEEI